MPMPKPSTGESREEFIARFMSDPTMIADFPSEEQRLVIASSEWDNRNKTIKVGEEMENIKVESKITCDIKQFGKEDDRTLRFIVTDESQDSDEDILLFEGWNLQRFVKNPVGLYMHQYDKPAMAKAVNIIKDEMSRTIKIDFKFPSFDEMSSDERFVSDWAKLTDTVFNLYKNGYMNAVSVGFDSNDYMKNPNSQFGRIYKNKSMLEVSFVSVPANENALLTAKSKGIIDDEGVKAMKKYEKRASGKTDLPIGNRDRTWDATSANRNVRTWAGGPEKDIEPVKRKIESYYKKMDLTAPWEEKEKEVDPKKVQEKTVETKIGNTLNSKNRENLINILHSLTAATTTINAMLENYQESEQVVEEVTVIEEFIIDGFKIVQE